MTGQLVPLLMTNLKSGLIREKGPKKVGLIHILSYFIFLDKSGLQIRKCIIRETIRKVFFFQYT